MKIPIKRTHIFVIGMLCIGISFVHLFTNSLDKTPGMKKEPHQLRSKQVIQPSHLPKTVQNNHNIKVSLDYEADSRDADSYVNDFPPNEMVANVKHSHERGDVRDTPDASRDSGEFLENVPEKDAAISRQDDDEDDLDMLDIREDEEEMEYDNTGSDEMEEGENGGEPKKKRVTHKKIAADSPMMYVTNRINGFLRESSNCNSSLYTKSELQSNILCATPETLMTYPSIEKHALQGLNSPCFFLRQGGRERGDRGWTFQLAQGNINLMDGGKMTEIYHLNCLPAAFLVGFPKCGTTELHHRLKAHHNVHGALRKEVSWLANGKWHEHFYDDRGNSTLNLYAYMRMFGKGAQTIENDIITRQAEIWQNELKLSEFDRTHFNPGKDLLKENEYLSRGVLLDSSPSNFEEEHLEKIAHLLPHAKLIFNMRDPVEREFSKYRYHFQTSRRKLFSAKNQNPDSFHEYIIKQLNRTEPFPSSTSHYHLYAEAALKYFKRENLMFIQFEEFIEDPMRMIEEKVLPFLNLDPYELSTRRAIVREISKGSHANESKKSYGMHYKTKMLLMKHFRPHNNRLAEVLNDEKWTWGY